MMFVLDDVKQVAKAIDESPTPSVPCLAHDDLERRLLLGKFGSRMSVIVVIYDLNCVSAIGVASTVDI